MIASQLLIHKYLVVIKTELFDVLYKPLLRCSVFLSV